MADHPTPSKAGLLRLIERLAYEATCVALGGPGSGNWGHAGRLGVRGGSGKGGLLPAYHIGITSHKAGERDYQAQDLQEFAGEMGKTPVRDLSVTLGRGAWKGGWEPTFVTQYKGNGEAIKTLASFGKKYNQDAVLVQRYTKRDDLDAQPQARIEFEGKITRKRIEEVEKSIGHIRTGDKDIGGWTWAKHGGKSVLILTCVPQFGGDKAAHLRNCHMLRQALRRTGYKFGSRTRHVKVSVMNSSNYDDYIGGVLTATATRR